MAKAKSTIKIKIGEQEQEFFPVLGFDTTTCTQMELSYLIQLGWKARVASAVRSNVKAAIPAIVTNMKLHQEMMETFKATPDLVAQFFRDKPLSLKASVEVKREDIFPKKVREAVSEAEITEAADEDDAEEVVEPEVKPEPKAKAKK